jgi:hypothetical protein
MAVVAVVSFRYHLSSLAAVFLALAVGVVVGSAALGPTTAPAVVAAPHTASDNFARMVGPRLVKGSLTGQRVLLLLAPDARPGTLVDELALAGASVAGQLRLRPALLDSSSAQTVDDVVTRVLPAGLSVAGGAAVDRAGAVLAAAFATSTRSKDASASEQQRVYGGFVGAGLLAGPAPTARATLVLVVAGATRGPALAAMATAFAQRVGVVVGGPLAATQGAGALAVLRGQAGGVSDVDGSDTPQGRVVTILALAEQAGGVSGHYGTGPGARAAAPDLS